MQADHHTFLARHLPGYDPAQWQLQLAGIAGSQRKFHRLTGHGGSLILMEWTSQDPDWQRRLGIHPAAIDRVGLIPRLIAADPHHGLMLEEDLGTTTLRHHWTLPGQDMSAHYHAVIDQLLRWEDLHHQPDPILHKRIMDEEHLLWESAYFAEHCVAGLCRSGHLLTPAWEAERLRLAQRVDALPKVWIHRDFQSENIMLHRHRVRFVDYQGARLGPPGYDTASLLYDPYVPQLTPAITQPLIAHYLAHTHANITQDDLLTCAAHRLMQALGAYGKLSRIDGLTRYTQFVPLALQRLDTVTAQLPDLDCLRALVAACLQAAGNPRGFALSDT